MPVFFHSESPGFSFKGRRIYAKWFGKIVANQGKKLSNLNCIFVSNDYLLEINKEFLKHNYFTDVITFNYTIGDEISGDIFVSIDQVKINSGELNIVFKEELSRVMVHGLLHLLGYDDKTRSDQDRMRQAENNALELLEEIRNGKQI